MLGTKTKFPFANQNKCFDYCAKKFQKIKYIIYRKTYFT